MSHLYHLYLSPPIISHTLALAGKESLKTLARSVGGMRPPRGKWCTNWDARHLPEDALQYAAFDAVAAYVVYAALPPKPDASTSKRKKRLE